MKAPKEFDLKRIEPSYLNTYRYSHSKDTGYVLVFTGKKYNAGILFVKPHEIFRRAANIMRVSGFCKELGYISGINPQTGTVQALAHAANCGINTIDNLRFLFKSANNQKHTTKDGNVIKCNIEAWNDDVNTSKQDCIDALENAAMYSWLLRRMSYGGKKGFRASKRINAYIK